MTMYEIANCLPLEARQAAARAVYVPSEDEDQIPRTQDGYCPLGVALEAMGIKGNKTPSRLAIVGLFQVEWDVANAFISDWDGGKITDLANAFGVPHA